MIKEKNTIKRREFFKKIIKVGSSVLVGTILYPLKACYVNFSFPHLKVMKDMEPVPTGSGFHDFGYIAIGLSSTPQEFSIHNEGNADLHITGISVTSGDDSDFIIDDSFMAAAVFPGGQTSLFITFKPTALNIRKATVTIKSDDPEEGVYTFQLIGYGAQVATNGKVVHVHGVNSTNWNFSSGYYGNHVNQSTVDNMVELGLMSLTGTSSVTSAWETLIPDYSSGKAIAIKVNFNNCGGCGDSDNVIDALIHPVNSVIGGLKQIGVEEQDIWVYDASRPMPSRFVDGCLFSNVRFISESASGCTEGTTFASSDPDAFVAFSPPAGTPLPNAQRIADVLIDASYLINIPIMKTHAAGVTLSFKNHFGSISNCGDLHDYISGGTALYSSDYNPMVDIYLNPHIRDKTVLTIGDGLFGNWVNNYSTPQEWVTFGNGAPNSLFLATDPVAIDCVMSDFLAAENGIADMADDYLVLAGNAGLGMYERGDPFQTPYGSGYTQIEYIRIEG
jgi:hypothetical protein